MRKIIFGGLLASTMLVPAFAQNNPPASTPSAPPPSAQPSTPPAKSSSATVAPKAHGDMWRASKLIGLNVYNDQNEKLGDISEVLLDKSGKVTIAGTDLRHIVSNRLHDARRFIAENHRKAQRPRQVEASASYIHV